MKFRALGGLRGRLALGTMLVLIAAILLADLAAFIGLRKLAEQQSQDNLVLALDRSLALVGSVDSLAAVTIDRMSPPALYIAFYGTDGELLLEHLPTDLGGFAMPAMPGLAEIRPEPTFVSSSGGPEGIVAMSRTLAPSEAIPVIVNGQPEVIGAAVVGFTNYANVQTLGEFIRLQLWVAIVLILLAIATTFVVLRAGLRPLRSVAETAHEISSGDLTRRIPITDRSTEIGMVSAALNEAFDHAEESEQRMRTFIADASHELRTPLASIHGWADLYLLDGVREWDEVDAAMSRIRAESARMTDLVDQLLLLARSEFPAAEALEALDLGVLVDDAVASVAVTAPSHRIRVLQQPRGPVPVLGDPQALRQLVTNLVANASVHTPPGTSVIVTVSVDRAESTYAVLTVSDDGPGMTAEQVDRAFDRFWRADSGPSSATGTGLGLAIARSTVQAHHGTLTLDSQPGEGLTAVARLPLAPSPR
jgi:two-component system OmpR family sensor kinase